ncbi:MAG TPA: alpha/beta hydrolase [Alphaproteobacteria bacterium]|nr:alpha/beta hydrolase [Alphaproteobacteria bacterium]
MADFILVHGAFHGGWCWDLVRPELEKLGHKSIAVDMPVDQPNLWIDDYVKVVHESVAGKISDDAYLVGHSFGGYVVPRLARMRPKARMILLCAAYAHANDAQRAEMATVIDTATFYSWIETDALGRSFFSRDNAIKAFFHDVQPDLADWAASKLRPHWAESMSKVGPVEPHADRVAGIVNCEDDRIILCEPHSALARKRYGIDPIILPGGHSPFLSHPALLAQAFDRIVKSDLSKKG